MKKIKIIISSLLLMNGLNASYFYKIDLNTNNNSIIVNNELPSNNTPIGESAIDENPNSEENINEWALFLQKNSNSYDLNNMQTQSRDSGGRRPPIENPKMPLEDIATIIRGSDARINLGASFDTPDIYNPLVFPTVQGLNNTIKEIVFYHNTFNVTGMGNVKVIKEDFIINFSGATSYENLSNLIKIGGDFALLGFNNNSVDLSFLRNLQSVNNIGFRAVNPLNISSINKNLIMNDLFIDTNYVIPEEDAYWIRDKLLNGTIKNVVLEKVGNSELLLFKGLEKIENIKISYMNNLLNLEGLNNLIISKNIEIINNSNLTSIENLSNLTTVETLDLSNNNIESLVGLNGLVNVKYLKLSNNKFTNLNGLEGLINIIEDIDLNINPNLENLIGLNNLERVRDFKIINNPNLTSLTGLDSLQSIRDLDISYNKNLETLDGLQNLKNVREINMYKSSIKDISALNGVNNVESKIILQEIEGGFLNKLSSNSYLCNNLNKIRMYTLDNQSWDASEICE